MSTQAFTEGICSTLDKTDWSRTCAAVQQQVNGKEAGAMNHYLVVSEVCTDPVQQHVQALQTQNGEDHMDILHTCVMKL